MDKKDGGKIENWQLHHIEVPEEHMDLFWEHFPELKDNKIYPVMFTGTVVDDPTGRWVPGYHMRSTYIINLDRETGIVETLNTIYKLDMKTEGMDRIPDLGNAVLKIFY
jgi:hypothetical protein